MVAASFAQCGDREDEGAAEQHEIRPQRQCAADVQTAAYPTVQNNRRVRPDGRGNLGEDADGGRCAVELSCAMVGNDDSIHAACDAFARIIHIETARRAVHAEEVAVVHAHPKLPEELPAPRRLLLI